MFYCEPCRQAKRWPESLMQSRGPCEVCGKTRVCHDRKNPQQGRPDL